MFDRMMASGVPFSLVIAAGPTLLFVPPLSPPIVTPLNNSATVTIQALPGVALTTDPSFPAPSASLVGWTLQAWLMKPEWYRVNASAMASAMGVHVAKYEVRDNEGHWWHHSY